MCFCAPGCLFVGGGGICGFDFCWWLVYSFSVWRGPTFWKRVRDTKPASEDACSSNNRLLAQGRMTENRTRHKKNTGAHPTAIVVILSLLSVSCILSVSLALLKWTPDVQFYTGRTAVCCTNGHSTIMLSWDRGLSVTIWRRNIFAGGGKAGPPWLGFSIP